MTTVAPDSTAVGPSEIAKDWGSRGHPVSRQYASKCIKLKGCPTTSLDAAWLWRTERTDISKNAGGAGDPPPEKNEQDTAVSLPVSDADSVDVELQRVRVAVNQHYRQWELALAAKPYDASTASAARKAYMEALSTRVEVEGLVADYKKSSGELVDLELGQRMIDERLAPFRSAIHGLDRQLAVDLFPEDPAKNRPRIREVIKRVLLPAITNAKRRLRPALTRGRLSAAIAA
jgi:hypothetical protein